MLFYLYLNSKLIVSIFEPFQSPKLIKYVFGVEIFDLAGPLFVLHQNV
jgi:hypothetical protein